LQPCGFHYETLDHLLSVVEQGIDMGTDSRSRK